MLLRKEKIMISTLKRLQDKRAAREIDGGFTLIELLIVIVVLGILAAVVVFSLGSVTSKSAVSACQADGATLDTAIAAYNANNGTYPTLQTDLTVGTTANGGPYLQSWPANTAHYYFELVYSATTKVATLSVAAPNAAGTAAGTYYPWIGSATCTTSGTKITVK
jgi:general secretion pathway protein G